MSARDATGDNGHGQGAANANGRPRATSQRDDASTNGTRSTSNGNRDGYHDDQGRSGAETPQALAQFGRNAPSNYRLALSVTEACAALGVGWDFWNEHVAPDLRICRVGAKKLVPVVELQAWLDRHAERALR